MPERSPDSTTKALVKQQPGGLAGTALQVIADIPEEEIWLAGLKSDQTRRAYRQDVGRFVETLGIPIQLDPVIPEEPGNPHPATRLCLCHPSASEGECGGSAQVENSAYVCSE